MTTLPEAVTALARAYDTLRDTCAALDLPAPSVASLPLTNGGAPRPLTVAWHIHWDTPGDPAAQLATAGDVCATLGGQWETEPALTMAVRSQDRPGLRLLVATDMWSPRRAR